MPSIADPADPSWCQRKSYYPQNLGALAPVAPQLLAPSSHLPTTHLRPPPAPIISTIASGSSKCCAPLACPVLCADPPAFVCARSPWGPIVSTAIGSSSLDVPPACCCTLPPAAPDPTPPDDPPASAHTCSPWGPVVSTAISFSSLDVPPAATFTKEEAQEALCSVPSLHNVSPSTFISARLDLEQEQCRVRVQAELKKANTTAAMHRPSSMWTALNRGIMRFCKLQAMYTPGALDVVLLPPSALTPAQRAMGCVTGVVGIEEQMRDTQCRMVLILLQNQLHIKS
ncbi:hypothetical protein C8J57DRAFT_1530958 [Mycena rebaudengoi]|nr:hypothetical protein C8J57DRAFT_1530958 [Mycena rebaudengoi]